MAFIFFERGWKKIGTERWGMPHPWKHSGLGWMELWAMWARGRYPCPWHGAGTRWLWRLLPTQTCLWPFSGFPETSQMATKAARWPQQREGGAKELGSLTEGMCLWQKAEIGDNPSVELCRAPSPAAGPGSANAEDIQRALSWCQARSSCDKGRFVLCPLRLPAHGKLQKFPCRGEQLSWVTWNYRLSRLVCCWSQDIFPELLKTENNLLLLMTCLLSLIRD